MRQRLLLVAGWVLAAVGTSVVASAAVAATGGQVTDRALRPLTAAEVAALPEGFLDVQNGSLASGDSSNQDIVESGESSTSVQTTQSPAGGEGEPFSGIDRDLDDDGSFVISGPEGPEPVLTDLPEVTEPDPVARPPEIATDTLIEHTPAGSVSLASTGDEIRILWATPQLGWQIGVDRFSDGRLLVSFTDGDQIWAIDAMTVDGAIESTVTAPRGGLR